MSGAAGAAIIASQIAAQHALKVRAIKASGVLISVSIGDFLAILAKNRDGLVVVAPPCGFFNKQFRYLASHKGLVFYTHSSSELKLPDGLEVVHAGKIWIPE